MKTAIIVAYFGRLPGYFQIFLDSCEWNPEFDWLVFSDDTTEYRYPQNVHLVRMDFSSCREMIQSKFDFPVRLSRPQKLCDYRGAYGYIFDAWLKGYDWWGHCDLDQVFGTIGHFVTEDMLKKYNKIGSLGHLTLYRNTDDNNRIFMSSIHGVERYREVFQTETGCAFDEWLPGNMNEIFIESGVPFCPDSFGADIVPYKTVLVTTNYNIEKGSYAYGPEKYSVFSIKNGILRQIYDHDGKRIEKEYAYIHLQKRKMKDLREKNMREYTISHNAFTNQAPEICLRKESIWRVINYQYFTVKYNSFKKRIRTKNWKRAERIRFYDA